MTAPVCKVTCGDTPGVPGPGPGGQEFLGARVASTAPQSIPDDVATPVVFDTVVLDSGGYAALPTGIAIPAGRGGVYNVGLLTSWADHGQAAETVMSAILVGSVAGIIAFSSSATESSTSNEASVIVCLQDGEELSLFATQDSGVAVNLDIATIWAYRIGDCP